jgi:hypothetical protein
MPHLDLSAEEAAALTQELQAIVENDRYPLSPRIRTLRAILAKLRPKPAREPLLPPPKVYAQQRATAARRCRAVMMIAGSLKPCFRSSRNELKAGASRHLSK